MPKGVFIRTPEMLKRFSLAQMGKKASDETKRKMSESHRGRKHTAEERIRMSQAQKGEKAHNWKGGLKSIDKVIRNSVEYKLWREAVFKRDDWTCRLCLKRGGKIEADHILPFSTHIELRFAIDNGRTLCKECHRKTPTWGKLAVNYK